MIQVQSNVQPSVGNGGLHQLHQINVFGIFARAGAHLQNQRRFGFGRSLGDALDNFHIVHVESAHRVAAGVGFLKHFCSIN